MIWTHKAAAATEATTTLQQQLATQAGAFPQALAKILAQRGILTLDDAKTFLAPSLAALHDPFLMKGMSVACDRIVQALRSGERILIYGDYDVDGTTSVALLQGFMLDLGFAFETYVPNRFTEGYGISFEGVQYAHDTACGLLIALDCGTKAIDKVRFAREKGIDVIVVDHHTTGSELPATVAMLNPMQADCSYPDKSLSACGLTAKLCQALHSRISGTALGEAVPVAYDPFLKYCDLVALSIACDLVPLKGENRVMLHFGLEKIRKDPSPGVLALKNLGEVHRDWSVSDLVFYMGPRINSAGRLKNATEAVVLLAGREGNLDALAASLDAFNEERKRMDKVVTEEALALIAEEEQGQRRASTVLCHEAWNKGIIGIVASRLIERHHRPTVLLTKSGNYLVGSGRSVPGFDLYEAIEACSEHLVQFGGHKYAAGLTLRPEDYAPFRAKFESLVGETLPETSKEAELQIDASLDFDQLDDRFLRLLQRISPFGPGNPEPNFLAQGVAVKEVSILKKEHVRFQLEQSGVRMEGIGFFQAERWHAIDQLSLDIVFQPDFKHWNGRTYIQLKIKDFRASTSIR